MASTIVTIRPRAPRSAEQGVMFMLRYFARRDDHAAIMRLVDDGKLTLEGVVRFAMRSAPGLFTALLKQPKYLDAIYALTIEFGQYRFLRQMLAETKVDIIAAFPIAARRAPSRLPFLYRTAVRGGHTAAAAAALQREIEVAALEGRTTDLVRILATCPVKPDQLGEALSSAFSSGEVAAAAVLREHGARVLMPTLLPIKNSEIIDSMRTQWYLEDNCPT